MHLQPGHQVRLSPGFTGFLTPDHEASLLDPAATYTVEETETANLPEEHWPNCPNPLDCCCLGLRATQQVIRLSGTALTAWLPAELFVQG